jgi:acyl dehydratase
VKVGDLVTVEPLALGTSSWRTVTQQRIDDFTDAVGATGAGTGSGRAASSAHATSTAPGHLLLSLVPAMIEEVLRLEDRSRGVNYGVNRLRFLRAVPSGMRIRGRTVLLRGERRGDSGVLLTLEVVVEREGEVDPALVAELLALNYA